MGAASRSLQTAEAVYYFAYNLHINPGQFAQMGIPFYWHGLGVLSGYRLVFNVLEDPFFFKETRGVANIVPMASHCVEGVVYQISETDLSILDRSAGVCDLKYYRKQVNVRTSNNRHLTAYVYVGWPDCTAQGLRPSSAYLRRLLDAAEQTHLSNTFRRWLQNHPTGR